ncbi:MAG: chlorite dismutase family protein [Pyrinomonadaceae bacterium]|nr:chlorite dismutase family protein [Pyrinomonadaceae bacterium]
MQLVNPEKEIAEPNGLRLVSDNKKTQQFPVIEKQFVNFMFLRVSPEWRKLGADSKQIFKTEFEQVFDSFSENMLLFSYSLVGFDSKADLMFWRIGTSLDLIQEMTAKLYRTNLGSYIETTDNYLAATKKMMFLAANENGNAEDRYHVKAGSK